MIRKAWTVAFSLALVTLLAPTSSSEEFYPSETPYWVDCSSGFRNTDCVESVEFSDPMAEKRDANGQLDYASIVWKKTVPSTNPKFGYKKTSYDLSEFTNDPTKFCDSVPPNLNGSRGVYLHDACYTASGLLPDGKDLIFRLMISGSGSSFEIYQWVDQGVKRTWDRADGWSAQTVPDGSTWRITLKSNAIAANAGTITANMKNPLITFGKSSDGVALTYIQGTVYPNQYGCQVPGRAFDPSADPRVTCAIQDTYAETASTGFSIYLSPYIYQFEKLKGYAAGGIFVTGPTGSLGQVQYDQEQGQITVPMYGPHFLFDRKTLNKGWMEVSIKGEVIRRAFNLEPSQAGQVAKVEISYAQGQSDVATYNSRYLKDLDVFEIRAYNFGFSSPTLSIKMPPAKKASGSAATGKSNNRASITCVKGKVQKVVTGKAPKCPKGYSIKR
jgi:hypothetical protein